MEVKNKPEICQKSKNILNNLGDDKILTKNKKEKFERLADGKNSMYITAKSL